MFWTIVLYVVMSILLSALTATVFTVVDLPDSDNAGAIFIGTFVVMMIIMTVIGISLLKEHAATVAKAIGG